MRSSLVLRNENIPGMRQEHADDDADVKLPMALPWMHELGCLLGQCDSAAGPELFAIFRACGAWLSTPLRSHLWPRSLPEGERHRVLPAASRHFGFVQRGHSCSAPRRIVARGGRADQACSTWRPQPMSKVLSAFSRAWRGSGRQNLHQ